jgi:hypothetical protein
MMSTLAVNASSSPTKNAFIPRKWSKRAEEDIQSAGLVTVPPGEDFLKFYIPEFYKEQWTADQMKLVGKIKGTKKREKSLYVSKAPLVRLLNLASKQVFNSIGSTPTAALVFYYSGEKRLTNPFNGAVMSPDILVCRASLNVLNQLIGECSQTRRGID